MPFYKIIDWKHRLAGKIINSERGFLFIEFLKIPREHIIDVVEHYQILKNPRFENRYTVLNRYIDYCNEIANQERVK